MATTTLPRESPAVGPVNLERLLSMKGGSGEASYLNNSQAQARHARSMLHLLEATLDAVALRDHEDVDDERAFTVADLGCSCGNNTLLMVDVIVRHIAKRYQLSGRRPPEFQAFFSDLPSNDFNVLFQLLPPLQVISSLFEGGGSSTTDHHLERCQLAAATDGAGRPYHAAGVPGSFHRRLFPKRSVDVFYSAFSLHWLSQVPESVTDRRSPAYNKGRVFIHGATEATVRAYRRQFQADLASFLRCRALEVRRGGSMFLVCLGRTNPDDQGGAGLLFGTHFQDAWEDLVQEGLVDAEKRDGFNVPVYAPSLQEFREAVEADGSFAVNTLQVVRGGSPLVVSRPDDAAEVGRAMANSCRSVCGVLVEAHVGHEIGDALFARLERRAASHAEELMEQLQFFHIVASLTFRE